MSEPTLSILVASSGRPTLLNTLESVYSQLGPGDELLLDVNDDAPWGHRARNRMMPRAKGDFLLFMDDDDLYVSGALETVRSAVVERRINVFRMQYHDGRRLWLDWEVRCGNVSTQMLVVPNLPTKLGQWGDRYEGDFDFIRETQRRMGEPAWHEPVIALYRP